MRFHYVRDCTLSEERDYWRNEVGGDAQYIIKWSRCMGSFVRLPAHTDIDFKVNSV
jgi:hypothetical protein